MARVKHATITLTGAAQQLAISGEPTTYVTKLSLTADHANTAEIKVGGVGITSNSWGSLIPVPDTAIPAPPYEDEFFEDPALLSDYWVLGTLNEKLHIKVLN